MYHVVLFVIICLFLFSMPAQTSSELHVGLLVTNKAQREAYDDVFRAFLQKNEKLDFRIKYSIFNDYDYKVELARWLEPNSSSPDIILWHAGERLFRSVREGKIEPITDVWAGDDFKKSFSLGVNKSVSIDDEIYGMPYAYYHWGFYYSVPLFDRLNVKPPKSWDEFLAVCEKLKRAGVTPIEIGTSQNFTAAAWFDYFNLRINGLGFHFKLLSGAIPYDDTRVKDIFRYWKVLLDRGYFSENPDSLFWKQVFPYLYRELSGMTLIGGFSEKNIVNRFSNEIAYFRFPRIDPDVPYYEDIPVDVFAIPKNAKNKMMAKEFMRYIKSSKIQSSLAAALGYMSPHLDGERKNGGLSGVPEYSGISYESRFSQFFDRDTVDEMAVPGKIIIADFLNHRDIGLVVKKLEHLRRHVFLSEKVPAGFSGVN